MALAAYGVLIGTLDHFAREDPNDFGSWYHGKMYVNTPIGQYECAVDVSTPAGVGVEYRVIPNLDTTQLAAILALPDGWHPLARTATSGAIDYIRSPFFHITLTITFPFLRFLIRWLENWLNRWTTSTGDNALNALETNLTGSTRLFVYGAPYNSGLGVHDIHMNQGDPPGPFQHLDAIWQDGGTLIQRPNGTLVAVITKFAPQSLNTDNNGLPI